MKLHPLCIPELVFIGTIFSPDDGHIFARNILSKAINLIRNVLHEFASTYKDGSLVMMSAVSLSILSISLSMC